MWCLYIIGQFRLPTKQWPSNGGALCLFFNFSSDTNTLEWHPHIARTYPSPRHHKQFTSSMSARGPVDAKLMPCSLVLPPPSPRATWTLPGPSCDYPLPPPHSNFVLPVWGPTLPHLANFKTWGTGRTTPWDPEPDKFWDLGAAGSSRRPMPGIWLCDVALHWKRRFRQRGPVGY